MLGTEGEEVGWMVGAVVMVLPPGRLAGLGHYRERRGGREGSRKV